MSIIRFFIIITELILCYILQSTVFVSLPMHQMLPDLLMIIVVACAYMKGRNAGVVYGFLAGLLVDIMCQDGIGFCAMLYMLAGFLCGYANRFYRKDDNVTPLALVMASEFLYLNVYYVFEFLIRGRREYGFYLSNIMLPRIVCTVLAAVLVYKLCQLSIHWSIRLERLRSEEE